MSRTFAQLKRAIEQSDETRYMISKGSGVSQSQLSRFVHGEQGLSVEAVEAVADYLGLEISIKPKRKRKGR